jgi:hypothetical protein
MTKSYDYDSSPSEEFVTLLSKVNGTYELHIGKTIYRFEPRQERVDIPASVLTHPDFQNVSKYIEVKR